jgi:hypothetical protein
VKYTPEIGHFIAENVKGKTTRALVEMVNEKFGTDFTESKMKSYKTNHKLKSGTPLGVPAGRPTALYPEKVKDFIKQNHVGVGPKDMKILLNKKFETNYTFGQIKSYYKNNKINSGLDGQFKTGDTPVNKGTKGLYNVGGNKTSFKPGQSPLNYKPVGYERVDREGYVLVKVQDDGPWHKRWRHKHKVVWEQAYGPIPKGHVVLFADQNRENIDLDNLILIPKSTLSTLNKKGLLHSDADLTRTGIIIADIYQKISRHKKKSN